MGPRTIAPLFIFRAHQAIVWGAIKWPCSFPATFFTKEVIGVSFQVSHVERNTLAWNLHVWLGRRAELVVTCFFLSKEKSDPRFDQFCDLRDRQKMCLYYA